jgi:hypothetical protein
MECGGTSASAAGSHPTWAAERHPYSGVTDYSIVRIELYGKTRVILDRAKNQALMQFVRHPVGVAWLFSQQTFDSACWLLQNFQGREGQHNEKERSR